MTSDAPGRGADARDRASAQLRAAILAGDVAPGQRIVEAELAEQTGVTRGSARAAIDVLVAEGLVERIRNRGARVRIVPLAEAISILECRAVLEGLTAYRAAQNISDQEIDELSALGADLRAAVDGGELVTYSRLNSRLHQRVAEISQQQTAIELIGRLRSQMIRHQFRLSLRPGRPQVSIHEHLAIIEAVVARQPEAAEKAARVHVESVTKALAETVEGAE